MVPYSPHYPSKIMPKLGGEGIGREGKRDSRRSLSRQKSHKFVGKFVLVTLQHSNSKVRTNRQADNNSYINNIETKKWKECQSSRRVGNWINTKKLLSLFCHELLNFRDVCFGSEQGNNTLSHMIAEDCQFCYSSDWKYHFSHSYVVYSRGVLVVYKQV